MDEQEEVQQNNMISNLPLLFANGYPTSLEKITESQLENFIPFMVQCSLGHINLQGKIDCSEPEWWPENLPFNIPFAKPKKFIGNWMEKMKEVVIICYQFHKSVFLLRFCNDLASYEHASLRFINNYNSTTSLFDRRSNKLLVTFRNENMSYDQPQRSRKCLLQQKSKNGRQVGGQEQQMMVEPAPFDIYLCDNCDAELYSKEAILEHEKTCNVEDDDDVILCDTPEPNEDEPLPLQPLLDPQQTLINENNELRRSFLLNFQLQCVKEGKLPTTAASSNKTGAADDSQPPPAAAPTFMIIDRNKRMPRRNRAVHSLTRCPTIPLTSPAGQLLLRATKIATTPEYLTERLERVERFCQAPLLSRAPANKPKYLDRKYTTNTPHCTFKKPQDYNTSPHLYVFPRRQFSRQRRNENFLFLNSPLIRRCRPISVRLKKISEQEVVKTAAAASSRRATTSTIAPVVPKLNIKLTRDTSRSSNWKISSSLAASALAAPTATTTIATTTSTTTTTTITTTTPTTEIIVDTIDLCSSDDDNEQEDGKAAAAAATTTPNHNNNNVQQPSFTGTATCATSSPNDVKYSPKMWAATPSPPAAASTVTAADANYSRTRLKKLHSRFSGSPEVSFIPLRKALKNYTATLKQQQQVSSSSPNCSNAAATASIIKIVSACSTAEAQHAATSLTQTLSAMDARTSATSLYNHCEGSLLLSPSAAAVAAAASASDAASAGIALPKPLRPSVYIFSNYTTNPLAALVSSTTPAAALASATTASVAATTASLASDARSTDGSSVGVGIINAHQFRVHNQENHAQNNSTASSAANNAAAVNIINKQRHSTVAAAAAAAVGSVNANHAAIDVTRADRVSAASRSSLTLVQSFGSPGRVVSIDLTS